MQLQDDELRRQLARRVDAAPLSDTDRAALLAGTHASSSSDRWRPAWIGWAATATAAVVLAVVVGVVPPRPAATPHASVVPTAVAQSSVASLSPGTSPTTAPPAATPAPTRAEIQILNANQLAEFASDLALTGQAALARVTIDRRVPEGFSPYEECAPAVVCPAGTVSGTEPPILISAGWRRSSPGDGFVVDDPAGGSYWGALLDIPAEPGVFAFEATGHSDELVYLGRVVVRGADETVWSVDELLAGDHDRPSSDVYAVDGWMVQTPPISCPAPQDYGSPGTNTQFWCGGSFITSDHRNLAGDGLLELAPEGLHVEWGTYSELYPDADYDNRTGFEPRRGTYLVRSAGCPPAVWDDGCPVWDFVGLVDRPHAAPEPPPNPTPEPDGALRLRTPTELVTLTNDPGALGMVVLSDAEVVATPGDLSDPRCLAPTCTIETLGGATDALPVFVRSPADLDPGSIAAYHVLDGALERIGDVALDGSDAWTVNSLRAATSAPGVLYAVNAWLTQPVDVDYCPDPPDMSPDAESAYWCNASWLTGERVDLPKAGRRERETVPVGALQVQNRAYTMFAFNAQGDVDGVEPWRDVYLVRQVGCPENVLGDCPVWELVANLDTRGPHTRTNCSHTTVSVDRALLTDQQQAAASDLLVVALVHEVGPSFWDSAAGRAPTTYHHDEASIYTLVESTVESVLKGDGTAAERAVQAGGEVGCATEQHYDVAPQLMEGMRYVLFMNFYSYENPDAAGDPVIWDAWQVTPDGRVLGAHDQVQLEDLADYLAL